MKTESLSRFNNGISQSPIIISRRKNSQKGTIGEEYRYKNLVEAMGNGISEIDHNGVSTYPFRPLRLTGIESGRGNSYNINLTSVHKKEALIRSY